MAWDARSRAASQFFMGSPLFVVGTPSPPRRVARSDALARSSSGSSRSRTPRSGLQGSTAAGSSCRRMRSSVSTCASRASWTCRLASPRLSLRSRSNSSDLSAPASAACTASVRSRSSAEGSAMVHPGANPNSWKKLRAIRTKNASSVPTFNWCKSASSRASSRRHSSGSARHSWASRPSSRAFWGSEAPSANRTSTRSRISPAAFLVKVEARIALAGVPAARRRMIRLEMWYVFPDPAEARTSSRGAMVEVPGMFRPRSPLLCPPAHLRPRPRLAIPRPGGASGHPHRPALPW